MIGCTFLTKLWQIMTSEMFFYLISNVGLDNLQELIYTVLKLYSVNLRLRFSALVNTIYTGFLSSGVDYDVRNASCVFQFKL